VTDLYTGVVDSLTTDGIDGLFVKKRIPGIAALDVFAARSVSDGGEALILDVETVGLARMQEWPSSRGFEIRPEPLTAGSAGRTRLHILVTEPRYRDVFRSLCGDVCTILAPETDHADAIHALHARLVRWQSFLRKHGPEGLSEEARCGLFGELLILRELLLPTLGGAASLRAWRGCKKAHQDFQLPERAVEVKTTRATIPDRISISNVQQLDGEGIMHMVLALVHVHENESTGETLPGLIDSLRSELADDARDLLEQGLEEVGYSAIHHSLYDRTRYKHIRSRYFEVKSGFPRIEREGLTNGVKAVRYEISLDACLPYETDEASVTSVVSMGSADVNH